jgi:hypothetical protein
MIRDRDKELAGLRLEIVKLRQTFESTAKKLKKSQLIMQPPLGGIAAPWNQTLNE